MTQRKLTRVELECFQNKTWPCCGCHEFLDNPEGGMFINISCPQCGMKVNVPNFKHGLPITTGQVISESPTYMPPVDNSDLRDLLEEATRAVKGDDNFVEEMYSRADRIFLRTLGVPLPSWYMRIPIATRFLLTAVVNLGLWELLLGLFYHGLHRADWAVCILGLHGMLLTLGLIRIERTGRLWK